MREREIEGVLLVDKPAGPSSHDVVRDVRRALHTRAVGHAGTLDPFATGLLVVVVGRYTRLSPYLTDDDKEYEATIAFGKSTTTDDPEGDVVSTGDPSMVDEARLRAALTAKLGTTTQRAPVYSAIQVDGERLYAKARRGEEVTAPERTIAIREIELLSFDGVHATIRVRCAKGTYIRALARDLGDDVGCPAHCALLRRTASGAYRVTDAISTAVLDASHTRAALRVGPTAVPGLVSLEVDDAQKRALTTGKLLPAPEMLHDGQFALAHQGGEPIAVVAREGVTMRVVRGFGT
jgi:tRNA pseudouridine55 synthase